MRGENVVLCSFLRVNSLWEQSEKLETGFQQLSTLSIHNFEMPVLCFMTTGRQRNIDMT